MKDNKTYHIFCQELQTILLQKLPASLSVKIHKVRKNNDIELDGLVIVSEERKISPNFYLQSYYEDYKNGKSIEVLAEDMIKIYFDEIQIDRYADFSLDFADCKERIFYRLVSFEKNQELLKTIPHMIFLDMVIIFYVLLYAEKEGIRSIRISNSLLEHWGLDTDAVYQLAKENTPILFPKRICTMHSVMTEMLGGDMPQELEDEAVLSIMDCKEDDEPYVITNMSGINGAAVILYPHVLDEVAQRLEGDYYLLPSSIHEMLVVSSKMDLHKQDLEEMVQEVNETCVSEEEILSEKVYFYSAIEKKIRIC